MLYLPVAAWWIEDSGAVRNRSRSGKPVDRILQTFINQLQDAGGLVDESARDADVGGQAAFLEYLKNQACPTTCGPSQAPLARPGAPADR